MYFNIIAIADDVSGNRLPDYHKKRIKDVKVADFLPSEGDVSQLKTDLLPLWCRVLVNHLKEFSIFREVIVWHIPHQYSDIMQQPSKEVCMNFEMKLLKACSNIHYAVWIHLLT